MLKNPHPHSNPAAIPVLEEVVSATAEAGKLSRLSELGDLDPECMDRFAVRVGKLEAAWSKSTPAQQLRLREAFEALRDAVSRLVEAGEDWMRLAEPQLELSVRLQRLRLAYCLL